MTEYFQCTLCLRHVFGNESDQERWSRLKRVMRIERLKQRWAFACTDCALDDFNTRKGE